MESLFIQLSDDVYISISTNCHYDWFCGPVSHLCCQAIKQVYLLKWPVSVYWTIVKKISFWIKYCQVVLCKKKIVPNKATEKWTVVNLFVECIGWENDSVTQINHWINQCCWTNQVYKFNDSFTYKHATCFVPEQIIYFLINQLINNIIISFLINQPCLGLFCDYEQLTVDYLLL